MEIHEEVELSASPASAWAVISDPYAVVDCVPGVAILGRNDDGTYDITLAVKFGPARIAFKGRVTMVLDEAARRGRVTALGIDSIGGTRARAAMTFEVAPRSPGSPGSPGSMVSMRGDVEISGRLASVIEGGAGIVVKRTSAEFAERLAARCTEGPGAPRSAHVEP
jgi:carbon monoxide dehydrogenase subunit G